ncbi:MAG: peptidoglycan-binding protein, partial [Butyrivibrio sp.]|nr:peptidoglycan-binding protein [Butyrivibrio sp.]
KLPERGYFEKGDGYLTLLDFNKEIKKLQNFLNWCLSLSLDEDGKYGDDTASAVKEYESLYSLKIDGKFGNKCLTQAKKVKK